ncbi:hypothetical protein K2Y00_02335 [Patescibacteria group bacterium]|nr:hypothetical protein [Patescibacteria group bacterium]
MRQGPDGYHVPAGAPQGPDGPYKPWPATTDLEEERPIAEAPDVAADAAALEEVRARLAALGGDLPAPGLFTTESQVPGGTPPAFGTAESFGTADDIFKD